MKDTVKACCFNRVLALRFSFSAAWVIELGLWSLGYRLQSFVAAWESGFRIEKILNV